MWPDGAPRGPCSGRTGLHSERQTLLQTARADPLPGPPTQPGGQKGRHTSSLRLGWKTQQSDRATSGRQRCVCRSGRGFLLCSENQQKHHFGEAGSIFSFAERKVLSFVRAAADQSLRGASVRSSSTNQHPGIRRMKSDEDDSPKVSAGKSDAVVCHMGALL